MRYSLVEIGICFCLQLIAGCVVNPTISGAGGQTTNGITVAVVYPGGKVGAGIPVRVRPAGYLAETSGTANVPSGSVVNGITDKDGVFKVDSLGKGSYIVEVNDSHGFAVAFKHHTLDSGGIFDAGTDTLGLTGVVRGFVPPDEQNGKSWYVQIYGLERITPVDRSSGAFTFTDLPAGNYTFRRISSDSTVAPIDIPDIQVRSNDTTTIPAYTAWRYKTTLTLNTTVSGADVQGNVLDFPVLIRLTPSNFNFLQAKGNGEDIRFTKMDGTQLPYEIERWDSLGSNAEIWVKIDTVYGNTINQQIEMYWGAPATSSISNGPAVFDTANGFTAVWHLNNDCSDVTSGKHGGTNFGATDTAGIIGGAKKFNGNSYIEVPGLLDEPQSITLSAWVHLDSAVGYGQEIISLGDAVAIRADQNAPDGTAGFFCSKVSGSDTTHVLTNTKAYISKTGWRYLAYTVDAALHVQSMYIDGIFQCSTNDINPIHYSGLGTNTILGTHGNKKPLSNVFGCIDEAAVCHVARSADWIKLCYMNQKELDALVVFK